MDYGRYNPGGKLQVFDLKTGNVQSNIIEDYPTADVSSVDVSFDGTTVVFTMKKDAHDNYHVYTAGVESRHGRQVRRQPTHLWPVR